MKENKSSIITSHYSKSLTKHMLLYKAIVPIMKKFSDADICFICDITKSMDKHMGLIRRSLKNSIDQICKDTMNNPRLSFIGFRDKNDPKQLYIKDFTSRQLIEEYIDGMMYEGGGDACEDLVAPLEAALNLSWRSDLKYIYMLIDAPTHGSSYHLSNYTDDFPQVDKDKMLEKLMVHLKENKINLVVLTCNNTTDIMIKKMKANYRGEANKLRVIPLPTKTSIVEAECSFFFIDSISKTFNKSMYHNFRKVNEKRVEPYQFKAKESEYLQENFKGVIYSGEIKGLGFENECYKYNITMGQTAEVDCRITGHSIGKGSFSICYYLETDHKEKYIAKIPKRQIDKAADLSSELEGNLMVVHIIKEFNKMPKKPQIEILTLVVIEFNSEAPIFKGSKAILGQKYLEGEYKKYNNNYGWVNTEESMINRMVQAFSHLSYEFSNGVIMITDIQGTEKDGKLLITDPAIHSEAYSGHFGPTNLGRLGMVKFFRTHVCNEFCKNYNLLDPKKFTIAELEKLPDKDNKKKRMVERYEKLVTELNNNMKKFFDKEYNKKIVVKDYDAYDSGDDEEEEHEPGGTIYRQAH